MAHPVSGEPADSDRFRLFTCAAKMCLKLAYGCHQIARPSNEPQAGVDFLAELVRRLARARELLNECESTLARVSKGLIQLHIDTPDGTFDEYLSSAHHAALAVAEVVVVGAYQVLTLPVPRACLWHFPRGAKGLPYAEELVFPTAADVAAHHKSLAKHWMELQLTQEMFDRLWANMRLETQAVGELPPVVLPHPSAGVDLIPGGFAYQGKPHNLTGRPRDMLAALLSSRFLRCTASELREKLGVDDEAVTYPDQVVKDAAGTLRQALKGAVKAAGMACKDPLPSTGKGKDLTYGLAMP